ncbi:hypothetical protein NUW54_g11105 [Trametes sanguinea]|uniref:Uncharacterized protein n=1 Tax=Trametes sanguinea TaxID=158606 RepID=A0ACC1NKR4_9APHY|nr:hypothetical protein NUW54_g11105 [Trametes sanguinea]
MAASNETFHTVVDAFTLVSLALGARKMYLRLCPNIHQVNDLHAIITEWRVFMATLTGPYRTEFERQFPGYLTAMEGHVGRFEMELNSLAMDLREPASIWETYSPLATKWSKRLKQTRGDIDHVDANFRRTTADYREAGRHGIFALSRVRPDDGAQAGPSSGHHGVLAPQTGNTAADVREVANIQEMRGRLMARLPFAAIRDHAIRNAVDRANRVINAVIQSVQGGAANLRA